MAGVSCFRAGLGASTFLLLAVGSQAAVPGALPADADEAALIPIVSLLQHGHSPFHLHTKAHDGLAMAQAGAKRRFEVPKAVINLDLPPEERWYDFYVSQREHILGMFAQLDKIKLPPHPTEAEMKAFIANIDLSKDQEILREHEGIIRAINDTSLVNHTFLMWSELAYERGFTMGCSGLLAATPEGHVFHGRNLDLSEGVRVIPNLVDVTFTRGGKPFVVATGFLGSVGLSTFYKVGAWSFEQNTRSGCADLEQNVLAARAGGRPFGFLARDVARKIPDFQTAVEVLASAPLMAPMYFTVAGPGAFEGAVITRDRIGSLPPYGNVVTLSPQMGRWYILQTNDDIAGLPSDLRRPVALARLEAMEPKDVNQESILNLVMTEPLHNDGTVFTWVLDMSTGNRTMFLGNEKLPR